MSSGMAHAFTSISTENFYLREQEQGAVPESKTIITFLRRELLVFHARPGFSPFFIVNRMQSVHLHSIETNLDSK